MTVMRAAIAAVILACAAASPALRQDRLAGGDQLTLSCENGRQYPLRPRAVSVVGDVVTGYLQLSPRQRIHVRLIPMGDGYRYAGRGIWFDGIRGDAVLFDGPSRVRGLLGDRELGGSHRRARNAFPEVNRLGYFGYVCVPSKIVRYQR